MKCVKVRGTVRSSNVGPVRFAVVHRVDGSAVVCGRVVGRSFFGCRRFGLGPTVRRIVVGAASLFFGESFFEGVRHV